MARFVVILALACVLAVVAASDRAQLEQLKSWVEERGMDTSYLYVNYDSPVRGLHARKPIAKGETFLRVPQHRELRITPRLMAETSQFYLALSTHEKGKNIDEHMRAGLWILEQKRSANSPWRVWLESLPKSFSTPQVVCSEEDLAPVAHYGEGATVLNNVRYSNQYIKAVQTFLDDEFLPQHPEPFAPHSLSFQDLQWAWYAVRTRSWTGLQVPFADMFNHHPEGPLPGSDDEGAFIFTANKDIAEGEEVFISYGPKGNTALWLTYGFTLPNNPDSCVQANTDPNGMTNSWFKAMMSTRSDFFLPTSSPCVTASGHGLNEMLHTIRLQLLTEDDLKEAAHRIGVTPAPITLLNEFRSYREALVFLESLRQKFLESVEAEEQLRAQYPPNTCAGTVLAIRNEFRGIVPSVMNELLALWRSVLDTGNVSVPKSSTDAPQRDAVRFQRLQQRVRDGSF